MLKDIPNHAVEDIAIAILPKLEPSEENGNLWEVYVINLKDEPLENVIVASKGYGEREGEAVRTSVLRHFIGDMEPLSYSLIEPIQEQVFGLSNEYWLSYYIGREIFDRKYVFLPESISADYFTRIPLINRKGVMIL
ncbi:MAG: hypothetical protein LW707_09185 [Sphingobacteriales bacterium]|jgi:hypothetical protein|nr:hypothetical protein [Sphingobacteriales bacterium]